MIDFATDIKTFGTFNNNFKINYVSECEHLQLIDKHSSKCIFDLSETPLKKLDCSNDVSYKMNKEKYDNNKFQSLNEEDSAYKMRSSKKFKIDNLFENDPNKYEIKLESNLKQNDEDLNNKTNDLYTFDETNDYNGDNWYTNKKLLASPKVFQLEKNEPNKTELFHRNRYEFPDMLTDDENSVKNDEILQGMNTGIFFLPNSNMNSSDEGTSEIDPDDANSLSGVQQCFTFQQKAQEIRNILNNEGFSSYGFEIQQQQASTQINNEFTENSKQEAKTQMKPLKKKVSFNCDDKIQIYEEDYNIKAIPEDNLIIEEEDEQSNTDEQIIEKETNVTGFDEEPSLKTSWDILLSNINQVQKSPNNDALKETLMKIFGSQSHITKILDSLSMKNKFCDERFRKCRTDGKYIASKKDTQIAMTDTQEDDEDKQYLSADECVCRGKIICAPQKFTKYNTNITVKNCECPRKSNDSNNKNNYDMNNNEIIYHSLSKIQQELEAIKINFIDKFITHIDKDAKDKNALHSNIVTNYKAVDKLINKCKCFEIVRHYEIKKIEKDIGDLKCVIDTISQNSNYFKCLLKYMPFLGVVVLFGFAYYNYNFKNQ